MSEEHDVDLDKAKKRAIDIVEEIAEFESALSKKTTAEFRSSSSYHELVYALGYKVLEEYFGKEL